jgi:hypothetical protein
VGDAAAGPAGPRPLSPWALATLLCGLSLFCPVASLAALALGARAVVDLRRKPWRRGGRMTAVGVAISVVSLAGWGAALRWWQVHVRLPMLRGPLPELSAGLAGDVRAFQAGFVPAVPPASVQDAAGFLDEVAARYGRLVGSSQRPRAADAAAPDPAAPAPMVDLSRFRIEYVLHFDTGPVDAEAEFVITSPGVRGFVLKFSWLAIRDAARGEACYPPGHCPEPRPESFPHSPGAAP